MNRREFHAVAVTASAALAGIRPKEDARNVLLVVLDDMSQRELPGLYGHLWSYGDEVPPHVPNITALAEAGTVCEGVVSSANCSPTRTSFQTGRYPHRHGIGSVVSEANGLVFPPTVADSVPERFRALGYATGQFGKCGFAQQTDLAKPLEYGWDTYRAGTHGTKYLRTFSDDWLRWRRNDDGVLSHASGYVTKLQAEAAAAWIGEQDGPWFAQVNFTAPHKPLHVPPRRFLKNYADLDARASDREKYVAAIEALDVGVGVVTDAVELEDTVVVVMSDNGTPGDMAHSLANSRKLKKTLYREGIEVPCVVVSPTPIVEAKRVTDVPSLMVRLFEAATGTAPPETWDRLDGYAYAEFFEPNGAGPGTYRKRAQIVRDGRWKLMRDQGRGDRLYDLEADPEETSPVKRAANPEKFAELRKVLEATQA